MTPRPEVSPKRPAEQKSCCTIPLHQRLVDPWIRDLVTLQDLLTRSAHEFFRSEGLIYLNLPLTTGAISSPIGLGSDSSPVKIRIGEFETYLADSMQFLLEYGCRITDRGCFYLMPSFRGESVDESHLQQFFHLEAEIHGDFEAVRDLVERFLKYFIQSVISARDQMPRLRNMPWLDDFLTGPAIPSITYQEALGLLEKVNGSLEQIAGISWPRVTRRGEQELLALTGGPVWLVSPPTELVPFYQASDQAGRSVCGDLLLGIGEICGAGERWTDGCSVKSALQRQGVAAEDYGWYVEMKELAPRQTAGFGIGVERLLAWVLGETDIRKLELLPRRNDTLLSP